MTLENLLLVSCRSPFLDDDRIYPPLGLLYLKANVNKELPNVQVHLVDSYDLSDPLFFRRYDAVGISIMTPQREEASKILHAIKKRDPNKIVIAGGPHVKHYTHETQQEPYDYVVPFDGERALVSILKGETQRLVIDKLSKENLSGMPRPDRTTVQARVLLRNYNYQLEGKDSTTAFFARGCPERCHFCEDAMTPVRWSSINNIKGELDDIVSLGYKGLYIFDDIFAIALSMVRPIAEEIKKRDLIYRCNAQARYFTKWGEDMAKMLADTGCVEIAFGAETGSQKILDNIEKRTTVKQNYQTVEYAKKHGLKVKAFILLGLPGEDQSTLLDTEKFIASSGIDDFQCAIYYPYKGTQIRDAHDRGEKIDFIFSGEGLGAYGQKGGATESVTGTKALASKDLLRFRNYLVDRYRPQAHRVRWEDKFFDTWSKTRPEVGKNHD